MKNASVNVFVDISSEEWRRYDFASGVPVVIDHPTHLSVSKNGHRILDAQGISHYIPLSWIHLSWKAKPGQPNFVK